MKNIRRKYRWKMSSKMKIMAVIGIIALVGLVYWVIQQERQPEKPDTQDNESINMSYIGNTISEEKDGKKVWELTAEFIEIDPETKNTVLKNIKGTFYQDNGETVTLTAPKAIYDVNNRNITITEKVKATTDKGATLDADQVIWDSKNEKLLGEGAIKITQGDTVITGDKMESNNGISKIKVMGNAHIVKGGQAK